MRISVFPKGQLDAIAVDRTMTVFEWIELARRFPAEGLELYSGMFWETTDDYADRIADALHTAGFEMPMLCASPDFTHPDPAVRAAEGRRQARLIELAARISGPGVSVRVLSGQRHPGVEREQGLEWAAEGIRALLPQARELDVLLSIENHYKDGNWRYPEFAQRTDVFLDLLSRIEETVHFAVQYDPSNAIVAGTDPVELLQQVIGRVYTMQASDRSLAPGASLDDLTQADGTLGYSPALQHGVIGQGLNDYPRIFDTLTAAGYDGWISIEDGVNSLDELAASVEFLRAAREEYFGGSTAIRVRAQDEARAAAGLASLARPALTNPTS